MANPARLDLGFRVEEQGEGLLVSGKGAGLKIGHMILMFFVLLVPAAMIAAYLLKGPLSFLSGVMALALVVVIDVAGLWAINRLKSPRFAFLLQPTGLQREGKLYPYAEIGEIFIDNPHMKGQRLASGDIEPAFMVAASNPAGMMAALSVVATAQTTAQLIGLGVRMGAGVNYRVNMRHGNKVIRLATSLDENTAVSLFGFLTRDA
ncbi:hypothetical protein [Martelella limonii]|uniref:hypothetical protein n=1 Tax=Martelella limonii TaxID=1647649 RepID=UPI0015801F8A|nr:hypothetical protein [Martelella limonii]